LLGRMAVNGPGSIMKGFQACGWFGAALLALGGVALAEPPAADGAPGARASAEGDRAGGRKFIKRFLEMADRDGDGAVSREEFESLERVAQLPEEGREAMFGRLDKDGDGVIRGEELRRSKPGGPKGARGAEGRRPPVPRLQELDRDGDGEIVFEEFRGGRFVSQMPEERQRELFDRLDRNGDGRLSAEDGPPRRPGRERGERRPPRRDFESIDRDGDGAVSFEEFRAEGPVARLSEDAQEDRFEALDRDGDRKLDREELRPPGGPGRERE